MGTDGFFDALPEQPTEEREKMLLDAVIGGRLATIDWLPITSEHAGHTATVYVVADALRIVDGDEAVRFNVSPIAAQRIADAFEAVLPTPRICDLVWEQAEVKIAPSLQNADAQMAYTSRMLRHHRDVEAKIAGRTGLVENVGKHWILSRRLLEDVSRAANYGWYDAGAPTMRGTHRLWQPIGLAHNLEHVDYSQVLRLVSRECEIDGQSWDLADVLRHPDLAGLVSDEGPLPFFRIPGVPEVR